MADVFEETSRYLVQGGPYLGYQFLAKRKEQERAEVFSEWIY